MCLEVVRDIATTKETHAMMVQPMSDAIGGYLQSFAIPIANQEYYEGNVTYSTASQLNELLKGIKKILATDGGKWTQPIRVVPSNDICPYNVIPPSPIENHCSELISSADLRHKCKSGGELASAKVPLPFLDNSHEPKSIAVPFRSKTLYSLWDKDSSNILIRYYTAASHCYSVHCGRQADITPEQLEFDRSFHNWLIKSVVPHLHDGNWYPAFGGVYRIIKHMSDEGLKFPASDHTMCPAVITGKCIHQEAMAKTSWFFVGSILGFLLIFWVVVFVARRLKKKGRRVRINEDDNIITYNYHCESEHSGDYLEAIVKTIVEDSSHSTVGSAMCSCPTSNESICHTADCTCAVSINLEKSPEQLSGSRSKSVNSLGACSDVNLAPQGVGTSEEIETPSGIKTPTGSQMKTPPGVETPTGSGIRTPQTPPSTPHSSK